MFKRIAIAFFVLVGLVLAILAASFWLVPKDRLNAVIAKQLSDAFGYNVVLSGKPSVSLFPYLSVNFGPLSVAADETSAQPLMEIARARGRLSVTSLWEGDPALRAIEFEQATITLDRDAAGNTNWTAARFFSKSAESVSENTQGNSPEATSKSAKDSLATAPQLRFPKRLRSIHLIDSKLMISDAALEAVQVIDNINATIVGPPRSSNFTLSGSFVWQGEKVDAVASLQQPGAFVVGDISAGSISITSQPASAEFAGKLSWKNELRGDGSLQATVSSAARLSEWIGLTGADILPAGKIQILGDGIFTRRKLAFRPISVRNGDMKADGRLDLDLSGPGVGLSGTLAFDWLVFGGAAGSGIPANLDEASRPQPSMIETVLKMGQSGARMDLRVSADSARIAGQEVKGLAAGVILTPASFLVNIGTAQLNEPSGGEGRPLSQLRGEFAVDFDAAVNRARANLTLSNTSLAALERVFAFNIPLEGRSTISFQSTAEGDDILGLEETLKMSIAAEIEGGWLESIDLSSLLDWREQSAVGRLSGDAMRTPFKRGRVVGSVNASGVFAVSEMRLEAEDAVISASGQADFANDRLSILGTVAKPVPVPIITGSGEGAPVEPVYFTLGGALSKPRISSVNGVQVPAN